MSRLLIAFLFLLSFLSLLGSSGTVSAQSLDPDLAAAEELIDQESQLETVEQLLSATANSTTSGFGPDYTVTKSGNGVVSVSITNTEDYVACFIMRDGVVVGAGAKKRSEKGTTVSALQKDAMAYNAGKGPSQSTDTIDCN